jgi:ACS family pantothenate transporter-like MFS transporter
LNTASYVFNAWVPNLIFPASKAPAYRGVGGYKVTAAFFAALVIGAGLIRILEIREDSRVKERQPEQALDLAVADENRKTSEEADLEEKRY